jgi:hypothetical protein
MQARNQGEQAIPTMPDAFRFQGDQPTALLLIEPVKQQIQLLMQPFVRMVARLETIGTLTLVDCRGEHFPDSSWQSPCS